MKNQETRKERLGRYADETKVIREDKLRILWNWMSKLNENKDNSSFIEISAELERALRDFDTANEVHFVAAERASQAEEEEYERTRPQIVATYYDPKAEAKQKPDA
jgi:hypothetical protein